MLDDFTAQVYDHYARSGRTHLPWRQPEPDGSFDAYKIMVSEIMLQQTQVSRAIPKYHEFLEAFPAISDLAGADLGTVLRLWSGLGYNRRAKFLHEAAQTIASDFDGRLPRTLAELSSLPGIGVNTAGAVLVYAFNQPIAFIETNVRTVYIHHFFADESAVSDAAIRELVIATLDRDSPREWYWALMDYGAYLKKSVGNLSRLSKTYAKQSTFQGSRRELRGRVLRLLAVQPMEAEVLRTALNDSRAAAVIAALHSEGLIHKQGNDYKL